MAYATAAELKAEINLIDSAGDHTASLTRLLDAASRTIDRATNRPDGFDASATATARYYTGSGKPYQEIDECVQVTAVAVKDSPGDDEDDYTSWVVGTVGTTTEADVFPATGDPEWPEYNTTPYTLLVIGANGAYSLFPSGQYTTRGGFRPLTLVARGVPTVKVTARWGYSDDAPADIKEACIMQAARWWKRLQSAMADTVAGPDFGTLLYRKLDPDIEAIVKGGRYYRPPLGRGR
jgi:hypothetical protein